MILPTSRTWLAGVLALCCAGAPVLVGCHGASHGEHATPTLPTTHPIRETRVLQTEYVAQIRAVQHIELRALERGYLQDVYVDEGQAVTAGQRLFQIMPRVYEAELEHAAAEADIARLELENTRSLHEHDVVSPNELALAEANFRRADAERALARTHLELTEVRAPFDGILNRLEVRRGSLLEEGELLSTLSDNSEMWVYFNVSEAEYLDYQQRVAETDGPVEVGLRLANGADFAHPGRVTAIEADFHNETGTIAFRATFPNPEGLLRHGETGKVVLSTPVDNALLVPQKAVFEILDRRYVFVVDDDNVVHQREIEVAEEIPHLFLVASGLDEADRVLLEGQRKVQDGQQIHVEEQEPAQVVAALELPAE